MHSSVRACRFAIHAGIGGRITFLTVVLLLGFASRAAAGPDEQPGQRFSIAPRSLPAPYATGSSANSSQRVPRPEDARLRLPEGFTSNLFATGVEGARWLAVAPDGDVFLARSYAGKIILLRDTDGDGHADGRWVFAEGFDKPHGMAVLDGWLYVADLDRVWRLPYRPGDTKAAGPREPVTPEGALGGGGGHWTRNIAFSPKGDRFYVAIGSRSNIGVEPDPSATVQEFQTDGSGQRTFASGLRNPVGIAFYPGTTDLYVVVNERDGLGDGLVPDYLTRLLDGGFYGWPYSYIGPHSQPGFADRRPDLVKKAIVPDVLFQSHSAPLGLVFYNGSMFPAAYRGDAFVALHGSWNAGEPTGYKIVRVPFRDGRPASNAYVNFATGFWISGRHPAQVMGRPVGLAVAADGSLLVADDTGDAVWRISYQGGE